MKVKIPRKWVGAISYSRQLSEEAVICLFEDGWDTSPTGQHTHDVDYLHFEKGMLVREVFPLAEQYFKLCHQLTEARQKDIATKKKLDEARSRGVVLSWEQLKPFMDSCHETSKLADRKLQLQQEIYRCGEENKNRRMQSRKTSS